MLQSVMDVTNLQVAWKMHVTMSGKNMNTSYDFESCWKYISGNYDADILDTKEHFMNQIKYMMEAAYKKGYDAGFKDEKEGQKT